MTDGFGLLSGTKLITEYQKVYAAGMIIRDDIIISDGMTISDGMIISDTISALNISSRAN
jgi:pyoverdine/dityrosine biosynthesis protein Dit1